MTRSVAVMTLPLAMALTPAAIAHPGGLDASGCHNNRKTGEYHCHRSGVKPLARSVQTLLSVPKADAYYPNCAAARAAGAAPIRRGQPGYRPGLDRDGDGVGCE
jgi:hypothetical protein